MRFLYFFYFSIIAAAIAGLTSGPELAVPVVTLGIAVDLARYAGRKSQGPIGLMLLFSWRKRSRPLIPALWGVSAAWLAYSLCFIRFDEVAYFHGDIESRGLLGSTYRTIAFAFPNAGISAREWIAVGNVEMANEMSQFVLVWFLYLSTAAGLYACGFTRGRIARTLLPWARGVRKRKTDARWAWMTFLVTLIVIVLSSFYGVFLLELNDLANGTEAGSWTQNTRGNLGLLIIVGFMFSYGLSEIFVFLSIYEFCRSRMPKSGILKQLKPGEDSQ